jgi:O-antigen/teichoic acid export membrane protein
MQQKREGLLKGSIYMIFALAFNGISLFLFQILSARSIGKEEFGKLSLFYSLFFFLADFLSSGFRDFSASYLPEIQKKEIKEEFLKKYFFSFSFYSIFFYVLLWIFSPFLIKKFFEGKTLNFFIFSLCFLFMFSTIFLRGLLLGFLKITYVAFSNISFGITLIVFGIIFYLKKGKLIHFQISYLISTFLTFPITIYFLKKISNFYFSTNFKSLIFPKIPLMMSTVNSILESYFYIGIILMKIKNIPYSEIGILSAILTFFLGIKTIYTGIFIPLLPNLSYALSENKKQKFYKYLKIVTILIITTLLILLISSITFLPSLWQFFFGKGFKFKKLDFSLISIIVSIYLIIRLLSRAFFAIKEIKYIFFSSIFFLLLLLIFFLIIPLSGIKIFEISFLISSIILFLILFLKMNRFIQSKIFSAN